MPFVTAVNGAAAGVGMSFALMGDLVLCAPVILYDQPSVAPESSAASSSSRWI